MASVNVLYIEILLVADVQFLLAVLRRLWPSTGHLTRRLARLAACIMCARLKDQCWCISKWRGLVKLTCTPFGSNIISMRDCCVCAFFKLCCRLLNSFYRWVRLDGVQSLSKTSRALFRSRLGKARDERVRQGRYSESAAYGRKRFLFCSAANRVSAGGATHSAKERCLWRMQHERADVPALCAEDETYLLFWDVVKGASKSMIWNQVEVSYYVFLWHFLEAEQFGTLLARIRKIRSNSKGKVCCTAYGASNQSNLYCG